MMAQGVFNYFSKLFPQSSPGKKQQRRGADWWRITPILMILLPVLLISPTESFAGPGGEDEYSEPTPKVNAYLSHSALSVDGTGTILVVFDVPDLFHIQLNEWLEIIVPDEAPITIGDLDIHANGKWDEEEVLVKTATMTAPFQLKQSVAGEQISFSIAVGYQGCSEGPTYACYGPGEQEISLSLSALATGSDAETANQEIFAAHGALTTSAGGGESETAADTIGESRSLEEKLKDALETGSFIAFLIVFIGGVLSSLTPCVYPMIPITISYVGGKASSKMHGFILSVFFVLGIAITYSALGLMAAGTGAVFGSAMQSTAAMLIVAGIFAAMGASMLGAFDIVMPSSLTMGMTTASASATSGKMKGGDFFGAILMGVTTGLVASPCVGPVLVVLLTFVADTGSFFLGFWLLFTFACGLGLLFLVLGTFAGALNALPGAGGWMDTVKHVFGVILIAMAIFYVRNILPADLVRLMTGVFLVITGVFTGAFHTVKAEPTHKELFHKALGMMIFLAGAVIFLLWVFGLTGGPALLTSGMIMPAGTNGSAQIAGGHGEHPGPAWEIFESSNPDDELVRAEAAAAGKPAIVDFWATWCPACIELDEYTWIDPAIMKESERFVMLKMDMTKKDDYSSNAGRRYAVRGNPTVIFYDSEGNEVDRFFGFKKAEDVLPLMRSVK